MAHSTKRALFLTNSEYGQANVVLAGAHALLHLAPDVEVHIASFGGLEAAVAATSDYALKTFPSGSSPKPKSIIFHEIHGVSRHEAADRPEVGIVEVYDLPPTLWNAARNIGKIPAIMQPYELDEFATVYHETQRILNEIKPDITAVDPLFTPGLTLCHRLKVNWLVLAPNTIKDFAVPVQPNLAMLWKYPLVCSALPFPLPWSSIPHNILLNLVAGYTLLTDTRLSSTARFLRTKLDPQAELLTANELGVLKAPPPGVRILAANSPELDYPFSHIPPHLVPCGPIVRAAPSVKEVDAKLEGWLARGRTIYIALGTHMEYDQREATEMARALRVLLDHERVVADDSDGLGTESKTIKRKPKRLQILWKLKPKASGDHFDPHERHGPFSELHKILGPDMDADRVRITSWVTAEPKAILESRHVVCSVNHGGASSFHEALCAGVPQVVLPPWADCYDFANRAELLGIGIWANKKAKPRWTSSELGAALVDVSYGPKSAVMKQTARRLAGQFPEADGRNRAAQEILGAMSR